MTHETITDEIATLLESGTIAGGIGRATDDGIVGTIFMHDGAQFAFALVEGLIVANGTKHESIAAAVQHTLDLQAPSA